MKRAMGHAALSASLLGRLSDFDMADLGPHASLLYRELITCASAGLPASTIILAAAIIDIVSMNRPALLAILMGRHLPMLAARPILAGFAGGAIICFTMKGQAMV